MAANDEGERRQQCSAAERTLEEGRVAAAESSLRSDSTQARIPTPNDIYSYADLESQLATSPTAKRYFEAYTKAFPDQAAVLKEVRHFEATGTLTGSVPVWKLERYFKMSSMTGQADTFVHNFQHNIGNLYYRASQALFVAKYYQLLDDSLFQSENDEILTNLLFRAGQLNDQDAANYLMKEVAENTAYAYVTPFLDGVAYGGHTHALPSKTNAVLLWSILSGAAAGGRLDILKHYMPRFLATGSSVNKPSAVHLVAVATSCVTGGKAATYLVEQVRVFWDDEDTYKKEIHRAGIMGAIGCPAKLDRFLDAVPPEHRPHPYLMLLKAFLDQDPEVFARLLSGPASKLRTRVKMMLQDEISQHPAFVAILSA